MKVTMKFEGGAELANALDELPLRTGLEYFRKALRKGAEPMRARMASSAPRGDPAAPNLHASMAIATGRRDATGDAAAINVGPTKDVFYGIFLELGTVRISARPFMRPAFDSEAQGALDIIRDDLWARIAARR